MVSALSSIDEFFVLTATTLAARDPAHAKTWRIDAVPWTENRVEAFAGLHNQGRRILVVFDEASAIPDLIWETTEGALTDEQTEILWLVCGNPTRNNGRFRECFGRYRHRWIRRQVDSRNARITNKQQIAQWIADYGTSRTSSEYGSRVSFHAQARCSSLRATSWRPP